MEMFEDEIEAINALVTLALMHTWQGGRVAKFLLAWRDSGHFGGFDPALLHGLPQEVVEAVLRFLGVFSRFAPGVRELDLEDQMIAIALWYEPRRPRDGDRNNPRYQQIKQRIKEERMTWRRRNRAPRPRRKKVRIRFA